MSLQTIRVQARQIGKTHTSRIIDKILQNVGYYGKIGDNPSLPEIMNSYIETQQKISDFNEFMKNSSFEALKLVNEFLDEQDKLIEYDRD